MIAIPPIKNIVRASLPALMILSSLHLYANEIWECTRSFHHVTIIANAGYEDTLGTQKRIDAFLRTIDSKLNLTKLPFKILILVEPGGLKPFKANNKSFSCIAYDTIRPVDLSISHPDQYDTVGGVPIPDTVDYGVTNEKGLNELGLKIIYSEAYSDTLNQFDRIYTLVKYGVENIEAIKRTQKNLYFPSYGSHVVSIKTIDTALINKIPTIKLEDNSGYLPFKRKTPFIAIVLIVCIVAALYGFGKK